ncbi:hypothetical protein V6Z11_1Z117400 [Gossypium hirsutum]
MTLRRRLLMPQYLRLAMLDSITKKDVDGGDQHFPSSGSADVPCPESPMIVFINPRRADVMVPCLKSVSKINQRRTDLEDVKPHEFVRYDFCAKEIRQNIRIVVAGGDGTVGWVLGCLGELNQNGREPVPPVAIIPLGTGNDLSRSFGWGVKSLHRASVGPVSNLDSWHVVVQMPGGEVADPPHSLKAAEECSLDKTLEIEGDLPDKVNYYEGVFYNYFSIGMDAKVAYGFHHFRNEKPHLAQGPLANKIIYSGYSCSQGWFLTTCTSDPSLRGLKNILKMHVKKVNSTEWEQIPVPKSVRAVVALNLHNYGSGRNPWGNLKPKYLEKRGFVEARSDDGLLEIFGLKEGWHASFCLQIINVVFSTVPLFLEMAASIRMEIRGGEWKEAFMQMDGEPWKQPICNDYSTFVEINRVPFQSVLVNGE